MNLFFPCYRYLSLYNIFSFAPHATFVHVTFFFVYETSGAETWLERQLWRGKEPRKGRGGGYAWERRAGAGGREDSGGDDG